MHERNIYDICRFVPLSASQLKRIQDFAKNFVLEFRAAHNADTRTWGSDGSWESRRLRINKRLTPRLYNSAYHCLQEHGLDRADVDFIFDVMLDQLFGEIGPRAEDA